MGELTLGVMFGPVIVMGSYYVVTRGWDWGVFLVSAGVGMIVASISLANNLRDMPDDRAAGIRTLPMSLGVGGTKRLYYFLSAGPYFAAGAALLFHPGFWPLAAVLASLPKAATAIRELHDTTDDIADIRQKALKSPYPLHSIRLLTRFGQLAVAGLLAAGVIRMVTT
jgi:1,4-dihydroxy-2-naphthoate octaprenyltransferase